MTILAIRSILRGSYYAVDIGAKTWHVCFESEANRLVRRYLNSREAK